MKTPSPPRPSPTAGGQTADIAIVGAGIIGLSCAYELARQSDLRIVVFDKQQPATGTTGGSAGVICLHDMGALYALLTLLGYTRIQELRREHDFGFRPWGTLLALYGDGPFPLPPDPYTARFGGQPDSIHEQVALTPTELIRRYPWIRPDPRLRGGVLYPNQGYLDPTALTLLYERLAVATGRVTVMRNTPVLQMRRRGAGIQTLVTRRGPWQVGQVLNAAGPWGAKVAALAGVELPLTPQRIQVCVASAFDDGAEEAPLTPIPEEVKGEGVWCRGEIGNTMLFGQHHHTTKAGFTVDPDYVNRVNDAEFPGAVEQVVRRYWNLPKTVFLNGWCCVYGTTDDGFPIVSRDAEVENLYHAVGLNGHGMTCHAGIAQLVAELMLRGRTRLEITGLTKQPETIDFSVLDAGRFARGERLTFELH